MTSSAGMGTLLAVLSKENGALLPLLLLVVEAFLHRMRANAPPRKLWLALVLGLPALAVLAYLAKQINFTPHIWPHRPFDQVERLYSETRIMWDYVGQLWLHVLRVQAFFKMALKFRVVFFSPSVLHGPFWAGVQLFWLCRCCIVAFLLSGSRLFSFYAGI